MKKLVALISLFFVWSLSFAQNKVLEKYVGTYIFSNAPISKLVVTVENGVLMAEATEMGKADLKPTSDEDTFTEDNNNATLKFIKNESEVFEKLEISASGMVLMGIKEKVNLKDYVGKYDVLKNNTLTDLEVILSNNVLMLETNIGSSEIEATTNKDVFTLVAIAGKVAFERHKTTGQIMKVRIDALDQNFEATKK